ncbi:MAG TPA: prepilin-type N-terminal cleavage/methylation domain-containing protein [Polyangiaceae bacterium]|nr:prepilin-type N-terminal cleavage/methylation domain-containing protein [Polyangiaceae bacterium]
MPAALSPRSSWTSNVRRPRAPRARQRGLTLLEVLIAIALIALLSGSMLFGRNALVGTRVKGAATLMVSSVRFGLARANATGKPVRLVIDFDKKQLSIEEASGSLMLREKSEDQTGGAEPTTVAENKARAEADRIIEGPHAPRARFSKLSGVKGAIEELTNGRALGDGVELVQVRTEHDEEVITEGRAYIYFWPGGTTERAIIQLKKAGDKDSALTVVLSPLTGRAKIEKGAVDFPEPRGFDQEYSEREE